MEERDFRETLRDLENTLNMVTEMYSSINVEVLKERLGKLEEETCKGDFWKDQNRVTEVNQAISRLKRRIEPWDSLIQDVSESKELMELAVDEMDMDLMKEIDSRIDDFKSDFEKLENMELLSEKDDENPAFLTIHPGAGGTESQDWANMLLRMYLRWAENHKYQINVISYTPGEEAGIKDATIHVKGEYVYGFLKCERGIHRLVRISPFDSNKRRHTSFASVEVVPEIPEDMDIDISESDLRIDTYRASGAGGQHVNTTDSAVRVTHLPTGIVVQCQNERSQHKNKSFALKVLRAKLYEFKKKELDNRRQEKIGEKKGISWGNQIRSYVFQPYTMVKDHRTDEETGSIEYVLDGDIDRFIYAYLKDLCVNR